MLCECLNNYKLQSLNRDANFLFKMNRFRFYFVVFLAFIVTATSFASPTEDEFSKTLATHLKYLHRPIQVYHYGARGSMVVLDKEEAPHLYGEVMNLRDIIGGKRGPVPLHPKVARRYFQVLSKQYQSAEESDWDVGNGLYAAIDPLQSLGFLGDPGFLLKIDVPAGVKYLDGRDLDLYRLLRDRKNLDNDLKVQQFVRENKVQFIVYEWTGHNWHNAHPSGPTSHPPKFQFCSDLSSYETAFEFVDPSLAHQLTFTTFSNHMGVFSGIKKQNAYRQLLKQLLVQDWHDPSLYVESEDIVKWNKKQLKEDFDELKESGFLYYHRSYFMNDWFKSIRDSVYTEMQNWNEQDQTKFIKALKQETFQCLPDKNVLDEFVEDEQTGFKSKGFYSEDAHIASSESDYDLSKIIHLKNNN